MIKSQILNLSIMLSHQHAWFQHLLFSLLTLWECQYHHLLNGQPRAHNSMLLIHNRRPMFQPVLTYGTLFVELGIISSGKPLLVLSIHGIPHIGMAQPEIKILGLISMQPAARPQVQLLDLPKSFQVTRCSVYRLKPPLLDEL